MFDISMGTVAKNGNGCGNDCETFSLKNTFFKLHALLPLHHLNEGNELDYVSDLVSHPF